MKFPRRAVHDCFRYGQRQQRQRAASSSLPVAVNSESFRGSTAETWQGRRAAPAGRHGAAFLTYGAIRKKPVVSLRNALSQRDGWLPAQRSNFGYIQKFSRRAIRFRGVPRQFTVEADYITD